LIITNGQDLGLKERNGTFPTDNNLVEIRKTLGFWFLFYLYNNKKGAAIIAAPSKSASLMQFT